MLKDKAYLDHGGATLCAKSLIQGFSNDLITNLYGNPHSDSSPSHLSGTRVDAIRERTLRFFNADPRDFDLIFTANATAAIKLVMDSFRDFAIRNATPGFWYGYHRDAHTSLVGIREVTEGLHRCFHSDAEVEEWIDEEDDTSSVDEKRQVRLFAYPGQSNMTGRRLPLTWPNRIRQSKRGKTTFSLLDAAALATTAPLDLSVESNAPDFITISFYKIFGFPNVGALIVRKRAGHMLQQRRYFGGGTVDMVVSLNDTWHAKKDYSLHDQLEDGTLPFHSIFALDHAISVHQRLYGSMARISSHTAYLSKLLFDSLSTLAHLNGQPAIQIYKDDSAVYGDPKTQGATIAFNVLRADGTPIGYADVEKAADKHGIYVRSGGLCNPGGVATYLGWEPWEMKAAYTAGHRCSRPTQIVQGKLTGVVRASLGAMSTIADVERLVAFVTETYIQRRLDPEQVIIHLVPTSKTMLFTSRDVTLPKEDAAGGCELKRSSKARRWARDVYGLVKTRSKGVLLVETL
ncbi:hypothetical protein H2201_007315 [Coniosporium apollinis]|uniref:Aminotransferase class V domain-containing protein n=1 Tax=Coniosporium apollinis TaxID=61459 RepID=A0ABQ9NJB9_9PEZI|nr:hypothetical protein H2201_007315 [Coniosporium apollinis]